MKVKPLRDQDRDSEPLFRHGAEFPEMLHICAFLYLVGINSARVIISGLRTTKLTKEKAGFGFLHESSFWKYKTRFFLGEKYSVKIKQTCLQTFKC